MSAKRLLAASALAMTGLIVTPVVANAAAPWDTPTFSDKYLWDFDSGLDFYGSTDEGDTYSSQLYYSGLLKFSDGLGTTESSTDWCTDPIAPGTSTTVGSDTVVTCAPYTIPGGQPGAGLTVTVEIRIIHALDVARLFYTVENTTGSAITVPEVFSNVRWEYNVNNGISSSGAAGDGSGDFTLGSQDTWVITTDDPTTMPSAVIWAAACDTTFTVSGDSSDIDIQAVGATTFDAGSTRYYANFLQMETPAATTEEAMNTAIADLADSLDKRYQRLTPALSVGMPSGIDVEGWTNGCPSEESEGLAPTGPEESVLAGSALLAAALVTLAVIVRKRRHSRV